MTFSLRTSDARAGTGVGAKSRFAALLAKVLGRVRKLLDPNRGVQVRARLTYAIGKATIAMGDDASAFRGLRARPLTAPGLCIEVTNHGKETSVVTEVGLTRGAEGPQIALRDPHLHDAGPWPRHLPPGASVVAHFGSGLAGHNVLPQVRRSYALSMDGKTYLGAALALRHYLKRTAEAKDAELRSATSGAE